MDLNIRNIESALDYRRGSALLDAGCDDGNLTMRFAAAAGSTQVSGIEVVEARAHLAAERGVDVTAADLNEVLPYEDSTFDVVCSNQVIEHLSNTDNFVSELYRILRPGGYVVASTENLASWHNVFALILGWQPFSLTNVSRQRLGLGNPLAIHRGQSWFVGETWQHLRVFAQRGLRELFEAHGFAVERVIGAGYYPLPARIGRRDSRHAAFITVKARKPFAG